MGVLAAVLVWPQLRRVQPPRAVSRDLPLATPPGITLQQRPAVHLRVPTDPEVVYADAAGRTLYVHAGGACRQDCMGWQPVLAPGDAGAYPDWGTRSLGDGTRQWTWRGAPLYHCAAEHEPVGSQCEGRGGGAWHAALYRPASGLALPAGIGVRELADAGGATLTDAQGLTLYVQSGAAHEPEQLCREQACPGWLPLEAPAIAQASADFAVRARTDGIAQWLYRGRALYRFEGDTAPGTAAGAGVDPRFEVALVLRYFMPARVRIRLDPVLGPILATSDGATLYARDRVDAQEGGHGFRVDHGPPELGRYFGTRSCDAACTREWPPLRATARDLPSGYWEIARRDDGSRQWVYRGYALYTHAADRPGETRGNMTYDLLQIESAEAAAAPPQVPTGGMPVDPASATGAGVGAMFWHAVVP